MKLMLFALVLSGGYLQADGNTAGDMFAKAVYIGDLKTMETFLSAGFDPDMPNRYGQRPLNLAMLTGETRAVELLLTWHADPNAPLVKRGTGVDGALRETPLQFAVESGNLRMATILIAGGARIDLKGAGGRTALHGAVIGARLDILHFLIEQGADLNTRDEEGASPLDDAVWRGSLDTVAILLAHDAHLNEPNTHTGATPVNEAAFRGNSSVVGYLLKFGPDLEIADKRGYKPLDNAIRMGKQDSALLLLEAEPKDRQPQSFAKSMDVAAARDESLVVEAFLRQGAGVNAMLPSGFTPLDAAASAGAINVVRVLLDNNADPNLSDDNKTTPLETASLKGSAAVAGLLVDRGAQVNLINSGSGTTALYAAASFGKGDVVELLLDKSADPSLCGENHKTPYQAALENGYPNVAARIQARGGVRGCVARKPGGRAEALPNKIP